MGGAREFSTDHFALRLGAFYAAYFFFGGVQLPFFPLWLASRGLDARTIGLVIAVPIVMRIIATPIITRAADRRRALKGTIVLCSIAATFGMAAVGVVQGAPAILVAFVISAVAFSPVLSLADAYALTGLAARGRAYGPVRLWGSVAFIAGNTGAGLLLHVFAPDFLIWLIVGSLAIAVFAALALAPVDSGARVEPGAVVHSPLALLRNPAFIAVVLASSLVQSSHALYYGFSTMQWRAEGLDGSVIGVLWGIGVAAEVALLAASPRLPPWLSPPALLMIGCAGAILRWTAMAFDPPGIVLPVLQLLHACSFAAAHLGMMAFMARTVPRNLAATAQGMVATWSGVVNASATFVSGYVYAAAGSRAYLLMAAMALAGLVSAAFAGQRLQERDVRS